MPNSRTGNPEMGISVLDDKNHQFGNWEGGFSQRTVFPKSGIRCRIAVPKWVGLPFVSPSSYGA